MAFSNQAPDPNQTAEDVARAAFDQHRDQVLTALTDPFDAIGMGFTLYVHGLIIAGKSTTLTRFYQLSDDAAEKAGAHRQFDHFQDQGKAAEERLQAAQSRQEAGLTQEEDWEVLLHATNFLYLEDARVQCGNVVTRPPAVKVDRQSIDGWSYGIALPSGPQGT